jgi:hypothetical protein
MGVALHRKLRGDRKIIYRVLPFPGPDGIGSEGLADPAGRKEDRDGKREF